MQESGESHAETEALGSHDHFDWASDPAGSDEQELGALTPDPGSRTEMGPLLLNLAYNSGAMGGMLSSWPPLVRTVGISTWAMVLLVLYFVFQFLIASRAPILRSGLSLYLGAILSNAYDRVAQGAIVDFVAFPGLGLSHWVFNVSDLVQWLAIGMILWALFRDRDWLQRSGNLRRGTVEPIPAETLVSKPRVDRT